MYGEWWCTNLRSFRSQSVYLVVVQGEGLHLYIQVKWHLSNLCLIATIIAIFGVAAYEGEG